MRNRFHSLCPYFAMFPESFVETWVDRLTRRNDVVLDPFCGRGTTPFQAALQGRRAIACDVNDVAYCISEAKSNPPSLSTLKRRMTELERDFNWRRWESERRRQPEFFRVAFSPLTLRQLLYLRSRLQWKVRRTDCMVAALVLGSLHGESNKSPSYLSNQMPRTISTKPAYSIRFWKQHGFTAPDRDAFALLRTMAEFRYESQCASGDVSILHADMRDLPRLIGDNERIRCVITSPPYFDVTSFEEDQWLRLWFLGGPPHPTRKRVSGDDRYQDPGKYWGFIADVWRMIGLVVAPTADVVVRMGASRILPDRIPQMLAVSAQFSNRKIELVSHEVSGIKRRQTDAFRPGSSGCRVEVDCHFAIRP